MTNLLPVITLNDGVPTTLSTDVATFFGKRHDHVIRDIKNIIATLPKDRLPNFGETFEIRRVGNVDRKMPVYRLTRDGFTFLAMGFTGEKAQAFKWAYIDAFNRMEAKLHGIKAAECPATITAVEQYDLREAVCRRSEAANVSPNTIFSAIRVRYQIQKYADLPRCQFKDCLAFVSTMELRVPTAKTRDIFADAAVRAEEPNFFVKKDFMVRLCEFVYLWRYLYKEDVELVYRFLQHVGSPKAAHFYEVIHDMNLASLEAQFNRLGMPVKDLPCYKAWAAHKASRVPAVR